MGLAVTTIARLTRLAHLEDVKRALGISSSADDVALQEILAQASDAIASHCQRPFARQVYSEILPGYGGLELQLGVTPIVAVSSVSCNGIPITDYSIASRDEGTLYRAGGWAWSAQVDLGLTGRQRWPGRGQPLPGREEPLFTAAFTAGIVAGEHHRVSVATISVSADDNSFNDSGGGFPALLVAGDVIEAGGFTAAANNGRFLVTGTPTASKIQVSATLTAENAAAGRSIRFRGIPGTRSSGDVEKACIETVKTWWLERKQNDRVVERQIGGLRVRRDDAVGAGGDPLGLPPIAVGLLRPWVRVA